MEANQVSKTAMGTAFMRAYHSAHDHPKIFNDFLAQYLITEEEYRESEARHLKAFHVFEPARAAAYPDRTSALASWMQNAGAPAIVLSRARYAEDNLEQAVRQGVKQYVILGAGMDTFALRRPDLAQHIQIFEIDHPATQFQKRQRLLNARRQPSDQLHFIPMDFNRDNLTEALRGSAYDPNAPTFFSWLGVTYYLTREALLATFRAVAESALGGSTIIFDYLESEAFEPERAARRVNIMREIVERIGEPMLTGFDPANLDIDLASVGLRLHEDLHPTDIQSRFFEGRTDDYRACEQAHFAWAKIA